MFGFAIVEKNEPESTIKFLTYSFDVALKTLSKLDSEKVFLVVRLTPDYQPQIGDNYNPVHPFIVATSTDPYIKLQINSLVQ